MATLDADRRFAELQQHFNQARTAGSMRAIALDARRLAAELQPAAGATDTGELAAELVRSKAEVLRSCLKLGEWTDARPLPAELVRLLDTVRDGALTPSRLDVLTAEIRQVSASARQAIEAGRDAGQRVAQLEQQRQTLTNLCRLMDQLASLGQDQPTVGAR